MRASADLGEIVMKSKTVQIMLLVGILSVPLAGVVQAEPNTIYVPDNYSTIQQAVNAANPGDTIVVRDGTYTENVNVNKDHLTIRSENGAETTIVQAESSSGNKDYVFKILAGYVSMSGFTVRGGNVGIRLNEVSHCDISNNNVMNNSDGLWIYRVSNSMFKNNNINFNYSSGIILNYSSNNALSHNNISSNCWTGILLYSCSDNLIYLNNFIYNGNNIDVVTGLTNRWNSPEPVTYTYKGIEYTSYLGNYWSDYTGGDSDGDGVGDTPYNINGDSDSHPLTGKFVENCIALEEFKVHNIDTGENFTNIQAAIDDANTLDGHVITIDAGEHYTSAKISKSLTIRSTSGNPADVTIYPVDPRDYVFTIVADHVEINGLTIQSPSMGIHLNSVNYCDILNNVVSTHSTGIYVYGSSDNTITGNEISSGARGMYLYSARNNSINTNVFTNSSLYLYQSCLYLYQSWDNIIKNNSFANGGLEFYYKYNNDVQNNTVNGKPLVYLVRQTGLSVSDAGQVILMDCNNVTIQGLDLSNTPIGAALFSSVNCKVLDNTMLNNNVGAYLYYSLGNEIARNEIKSWVDCIRLSQYSSSNKIVNNVLRISGSRAIMLERSSSNLINFNNILSERGEGSLEAGDWLGIVLRGSSNNTLTKNNVEHNLDRYKQNGCWTIGEGIGISLEQWDHIKSTGNLISTNTISYTRKGISLESSYDNTISDNNLACTGIYVYGSYRNTVSGNVATAEPNLYPAQHVESKPILYFEDATGQTIKDMDLAQLILVNCQNITVQNVDLNFGLQMLKTSNSEIKDNYVSAELLVRRASENGYIAETERLGVYLEESSNNLVSHNELSCNLTRGISLKYAQNNIIIKNNISGYWWPGYAIEKSSGNKIYLNNFYRSDDYDRFSDSQSINTWNSPEEITYTYNGNDYSNLLGNYWEDYTETDADGDGIGDTPYSIDSVTDNYPLVKPFPNYFRIVIDATAPPGGNGTPANPYNTITSGIATAHYGDTIRVRAGSYRENISLPRGINLVGASANITVIEGEGKGDVITAAHNTTIEGFTIKGSGPSGAGISIIEDSLYPGCTCNIRNNIITANYNGILLRNIWGGSRIVNNTIVRNSGSGVFFDYSYVSPTNNLITNNNYGIYCTNRSYPGMYYNNVWGNNLNYSGTSNPTGKNGNISSDPLLVDVGSDNYHLKLGSPCIDTGNPAGDYTGQTDIDGEPRVMNGRVDIGADEYPSSVSQSWTFDSDFQYNLDNDYATVEGTAHIRGTAGLSDAGLSVQAELTFNGPPAAVIPELYLIATDGPDRELAQQLVDPRYFTYMQTSPNTYQFSGFIPDVIRPINNGHYEVAILVPYGGGKYHFFINTNSRINSHYFPLIPIGSYLPDKAGNTLSTACYLGTLSGSVIVRDFVGPRDLNDYYSFSVVASVSNFTVTLDELSTNAKLALIEDKNDNRVVEPDEVIALAYGSPSLAASISRPLELGTYYVLVSQRYTNDNTEYDLTLTVVQEPVGPAGAPPSQQYFLGNQEKISGSSADPVSTATGNFTHIETELSIATRGKPLEFSRYYNSKDAIFGPLGFGWRHSYYIYLVEDVNIVNVHWSDGHTDYWNPNGEGGYEPNTAGLYDSLVKNGNNWVVTKKSLDKYIFNANGLLTSISDKNGNTFTLAYDNLTYPSMVTSVSDPIGRTITLTYDASGLLTSVTDFASPPRVVSYHYTQGFLTQVTDVMGDTIQYSYDSNGYLKTITDQRGVTIVTNTYDSQGRVIQQWDGNGNKTTFAYDAPDVNQTTITDPNNKTTIHTHFSGYKLLGSIKNPLGGVITYYYDENMNRTAIVDRNRNATLFSYNNRGNVTAKTDPNNPADPYDGGFTTVEYNDVNFPDMATRKIDALGNIWTYEYDDKGNLIRQLDPNGNERSWTYNSFGQKLADTDENGNTTNYIYDANGLLTDVLDPNGNHTWYGYDELWRLTHVTDGRGSFADDPRHTTVTVYDEADRVTSVAGPITSDNYQYDEVGNRTTVINGRGFKTINEYDNNNNLIKVERVVPGDVNQVTQYTHDELNRKISMTDPNGNVTTYDYDATGRLIKETNAEADTTTYTYDTQGNVLSVTDGSGVTISYEYDALNRKTRQYDELGNHWQWQYNKFGHLIKHTDAMGYEKRYEYDCLGRLISVIDDANNTTRYKYDAVGNLTQITDASGKVIERRFYDTINRLIQKENGLGYAYVYTYDGAGNIILETNPNGDAKIFLYDNENRLIEIHYPDSSQVAYTYDENGNLVSMTDPTGTTTYTYDELDRLTSSTDSFGKQVLYGYDIIGNRTSITYSADSSNPARTVTYTYDRANRLDKVIDWAGITWDYAVDGAGRITEVNYPNGIKELRSYDNAGRLSSLVYKNSSDANLINYSYTRDAQGNPIEIKENGTLEPVLNLPLKEDYTYDNDNRLIGTTRPATYGYDNNGNMTRRVSGGVMTTFTYDFDNRLISQTTGSSTIEHIYDGHGDRIARNDNGLVTRYVLDHGRSMSHILCETDVSGEIIAYYIHGPQILARIGFDGSQRYYHTDHIGSVVALTDEIEAVTDRYAYTPFGVPAGREGSSPNPFTYVGGLGVMAEADELYFMRARFYDPGAGRLLQKDPIGYADSLNVYVYSNNSPVKFVDASGLCVAAKLAERGISLPLGSIEEVTGLFIPKGAKSPLEPYESWMIRHTGIFSLTRSEIWTMPWSQRRQILESIKEEWGQEAGETTGLGRVVEVLVDWFGWPIVDDFFTVMDLGEKTIRRELEPVSTTQDVIDISVPWPWGRPAQYLFDEFINLVERGEVWRLQTGPANPIQKILNTK
jgi:RHS repeat-associated protein